VSLKHEVLISLNNLSKESLAAVQIYIRYKSLNQREKYCQTKFISLLTVSYFLQENQLAYRMGFVLC
jgi:hypothetical protein